MDATDRSPSGPAALLHGLPGHPLHPPLTDATIGMFVLATGLAIIGKAGAITEQAGPAMWLALIGGLIVAVPTPPGGMAGWLRPPLGGGARGPAAGAQTADGPG